MSTIPTTISRFANIGKCINDELAASAGSKRAEVVHKACSIIDRSIHSGYRIFPCNYIAYDEINGTNKYADMYTVEDVDVFDRYIETQLSKVEEPDITPDEQVFMRQMMLTMYANPLRNQISAGDNVASI